jgi:hypothetical protein
MPEKVEVPNSATRSVPSGLQVSLCPHRAPNSSSLHVEDCASTTWFSF